ncbi:Panacea domain-containing protein [Thiocapsa roseopersicina]|uniref:Uncharacterized phage-associated protein n=1 Tax=Thiocapsa roseopersicina TaxID=1058 RepID=A0A1H2X4R9_THIRO|nr:type II toxin-antitoxin system antitoxin SocA domain-containing protein [Thiocapsa roseopersicina]SDW87815.1 Uncharacterized phage-associated protein [Thiocapsa roseopersicina]
MKYPAIDIAFWFINSIDRESGDSISPLKLQKLLYFAEAWTLVLLNRELLQENFEAWAHGPVVRSVYHEFKAYSWASIPPQERESETEIDPDTENVLRQVLDVYGEFSAKTLENMTHADAPWIEARGSLSPEARCTNRINKARMKEHFLEKYGDAINGEAGESS